MAVPLFVIAVGIGTTGAMLFAIITRVRHSATWQKLHDDHPDHQHLDELPAGTEL